MNQKVNSKKVICFRRWKRKPWAAFASMGKVVKIGVLCVGYSIIVFKNQPLQAQAQTRTGGEISYVMEELVINTERPTPFQPLVRVVAVIQKQEIERSAVQNLQDLLRYVQGADLRSRGSEGVQADINILGGTFDQTIVMVNGINFTDPQTGHHSLNIPVDISQIARIEILQGPGAWSEGTVAYSGAINIITLTPVETALRGSLSGGSFGYFRGAANLQFSSAKNSPRNRLWNISGQIGSGYSRSDGYSHNTDFDIVNIYTSITASNAKDHSFNFQAGYQQKAFGANSFYSTDYPEQFEKTKTFLSSLQYLRQKARWQLSAILYHRRLYDRFELFRYLAADWYEGHNYHQNDIAGLSVKAAYRWQKAGTTVIGAEWRTEHIYSNQLGTPMKHPKHAPFETAIEYTNSMGRDIRSLYIRHILQLARWRFTAGVMYGNNRLYAGLNAAYSLTPCLELNGWVNNSYRNPTFTDLFYKSPNQSGNINLKPEEAIAAHTGLRYTKHNLRVSLSAYYRYGYRIIDWVRETGKDEYRASNITNVISGGVEFGFTYLINTRAINSIALFYTYTDVNKKSGNMHSLYATDFLRHKALLSLDHNIFPKLSARWNLSFQKREGSYPNKNGEEIAYTPFLLTDLKVVWNTGKIDPFAEVTNLFNTEYLYIGNLPQPGRWIKVGASFEW
jgi:Outer membrane cobalamin receptor protein